MDPTTVLGLIIAWGALIASLALEGGSLKELFNFPALILVVFGTIGATLISTSIKTISTVPSVFVSVMVGKDLDPSEIIDSLVNFAGIARKQGVLALDHSSKNIKNKFLRKGIELIIDGTPSIMVREILDTEIAAMQERHKAGEAVFSTLGGFSPTLGIIGTVMGLISMLSKLSEPGKMGGAIAGAFIATLYGVALANLLYLPVANKLKSKSSQEIIIYEMIVEGVLSIQSGESPRVVENRMVAFLPPAIRYSRFASVSDSAQGRKAA